MNRHSPRRDLNPALPTPFHQQPTNRNHIQLQPRQIPSDASAHHRRRNCVRRRCYAGRRHRAIRRLAHAIPHHSAVAKKVHSDAARQKLVATARCKSDAARCTLAVMARYTPDAARYIRDAHRRQDTKADDTLARRPAAALRWACS